MIEPVSLQGPRGRGSQKFISTSHNRSVHPGKQIHSKSMPKSSHTPFTHPAKLQMDMGLGDGSRMKVVVGRNIVRLGLVVNLAVSCGGRVVTGMIVVCLRTVVKAGDSNMGVDVGGRIVSEGKNI